VPVATTLSRFPKRDRPTPYHGQGIVNPSMVPRALHGAASISRFVVRPLDMETTLTPATTTRRPLDKTLWASRILAALVILLLLFDAAGKLLRLRPVVEGTVRVGYSEAVIVPLGIVLLVSTVLYAMPRTALLGAILLTGWLGGATATHVRIGEPFWMPVLFGVVVWGCLYLRDERVRSLLPFRASSR
jgi:DoxX-like protein